MGYMRHRAMIVTGYKKESMDKVRIKALKLGLKTSEPVESNINGYVSIMIAPDGSKEGWGHSDEGEKARDKLVRWMKKMENHHLTWVLVKYGADDSPLDVAEVEDCDDGFFLKRTVQSGED